MRERILITGPCGRIGPHLVPFLREHFAVRLFDLKPFPNLQAEDEMVLGDIRDPEAIERACRGVAGVIHLAAISDEDDFYTKLMPVNLEGTYNVFEAARRAQVPKVIFASTCQVVLNYGDGVWVTPEMPVRPSTVYACTKVFGEALARKYVDRHGLSIICIRIAWFQGYDSPLLRKQPELRTHWCSPRDLSQLMVRALRSDVQFGIFFGVSNNTGRFWDISNAEQLLGYKPIDDGLTGGGEQPSRIHS